MGIGFKIGNTIYLPSNLLYDPCSSLQHSCGSASTDTEENLMVIIGKGPIWVRCPSDASIVSFYKRTESNLSLSLSFSRCLLSVGRNPSIRLRVFRLFVKSWTAARGRGRWRQTAAPSGLKVSSFFGF